MHGLSPSELKKRRRNAAKIARYRLRQRNGHAVYSVEVPKADILHALRFRGLSKTASKKQIEETLSQLLTEIAARWKEGWPPL